MIGTHPLAPYPRTCGFCGHTVVKRGTHSVMDCVHKLRNERDAAYLWILAQPEPTIDPTCEECDPRSPLMVEGHDCAYHAAQRTT